MVAINGSTGAVLGCSLITLRDFVNSTLSEIRLSANVQDRKQFKLAAFLDDIAITGGLHAGYRRIEFRVELVDPELEVGADAQLLASGEDRTGLGLGLSIARKAVRAQGGDISIRNRPGVGCVFVIDLPMQVEGYNSFVRDRSRAPRV